MSIPRYAIYYVPEADSALYRFGAELLGYDAFSGESCAQRADALRQFADWSALTQEPRRYGFHATLKAPFVLATGAREADLITALETFAASPRRVPVFQPAIDLIGDFIAIVPLVPPPALRALADDCVKQFDRFRAPITEDERVRRLRSSLTPRQIMQVDGWGYPYVFEDFRFHMTLTGRLAPETRHEVRGWLRARFAELAIRELTIDAVSIFRQPAPDRPFEIIAFHRLHEFR